jgi:hypothetical protein
MYVTVRGKAAKLTQDETIEAVEYFGQKLMSNKLLSGLDIEIHYDYKLNCYGSCEWMDQNHRPKEYRIAIKGNLTYRKTLITLAHEIVHIKQYATGEMKELMTRNGLSRKMIRWNGKYINSHKIDYYDQPWEIEAHGREYGLYERYMRNKPVQVEKIINQKERT